VGSDVAIPLRARPARNDKTFESNVLAWLNPASNLLASQLLASELLLTSKLLASNKQVACPSNTPWDPLSPTK